MASQEDRANDLVQQAERKLQGSRGFLGGMFGGGNSRSEEAAELYLKAANLYKLAKSWERAGEVFKLAAECQAKNNSRHEAASNLISASHCYKKGNNKETAIRCLKAAIEYYTEEGRFAMAAKYMKEVAEQHESDLNLEAAMEAYQQAADFYEGEGSVTSANQCLLKVAEFAAQRENYALAVELFQRVGMQSLENRLTSYSAKEYFFKAVLCHMASGDSVAARKALEKYSELDHMFGSQREHKFLDSALKAYEEYDVEEFTNAVVDYDSISKLDNWKTTILLRIKNAIKQEETDLA